LERAGREVEMGLRAGRVGGVESKAEVLNQVDRRDYGETSEGPAGVHPLEIPGVCGGPIGARLVERGYPESAFAARVKTLFERGQPRLPTCHRGVVLLPGAPPRGPAPNPDVFAEVIAGGGTPTRRQKVGTVDVHDVCILPIACQHGVAEGEKRGIGEAVVFENNRFLDEGKSPVQAGDDALPAALVAVGVVGKDFARPVHALGNEFAHLGHAPGIGRDVRARSVAHDKQLRWPCLPDALQHPARRFRAVEHDEYDGGVHWVVMVLAACVRL